MKRKLVKQGAATLMVSLPSKWAKENSLGKGDEVNIEEENQNLIIKVTEDTKKEQKAKIDVSNYAPLTNVVLINLYIKGIDELEITFNKPEIIKEYQNRTIPELIGFEIIKQTNNSILLKDITGENTMKIDDIIKRIFFVIDSMIEEFVEAVEKQQGMDPIIDLDASVNKFTNFCLRALNKKGYPDRKKTIHIYGIVKQLEEVGDVYKSIAQAIKEKEKIDKHQLEIIKETKNLLELFKEALFNFNQERAVQFARKYEDIRSKIKGKTHIDFLLAQLNQTIIQMNHFLLVMNL